jgi:hypothetical protein
VNDASTVQLLFYILDCWIRLCLPGFVQEAITYIKSYTYIRVECTLTCPKAERYPKRDTVNVFLKISLLFKLSTVVKIMQGHTCMSNITCVRKHFARQFIKVHCVYRCIWMTASAILQALPCATICCNSVTYSKLLSKCNKTRSYTSVAARGHFEIIKCKLAQ